MKRKLCSSKDSSKCTLRKKEDICFNLVSLWKQKNRFSSIEINQSHADGILPKPGIVHPADYFVPVTLSTIVNIEEPKSQTF